MRLQNHTAKSRCATLTLAILRVSLLSVPSVLKAFESF
jgi:hypothetical protein